MKRYYDGQAIAIILVVIVICAIIAAAVISRTLLEQKRTVGEQTSSEAMQTSDSIIELIRAMPIDSVTYACDNGTYGKIDSANGCTIQDQTTDNHNIESFVQMVSQRSSGTAANEIDLNQMFNCPTDQNLSDRLLQIKLVQPGDDIEVAQDNNLSVFDTTGSCTGISFSIRPENSGTPGVAINSGVVVSNYYFSSTSSSVDNPTSFKPYDTSDIVGYCFINGTACGADYPSTSTTGWKSINKDTQSLYNFSINYAKAGFTYAETRIRPVGDSAFVSNIQGIGTNCKPSKFYRVKASATCNGSYRGVEVIVPEKESPLGIFDYVLYNKNGDLGFSQ